jgi:hypothetical protein
MSALFLARDLEAVARILVLAAGTPGSGARRAGRMALQFEGHPLFFLRVPQPATREPLHHRVGVFRLQLLQCRLQLLRRVGAERGRLAVEDDGPIRVAWRHGWCD